MKQISKCLEGKMIPGIGMVIILALMGFFYLHSKEDYRHLVLLIRDEAYQLSDIVIRGIRHDMLLNRRADLQQRIGDIVNHDKIIRIRIIKDGRVKVASNTYEIGMLIDKKSEGCIECHRGNSQLPSSRSMKDYRIFQPAYGSEAIGIMNPIYNEKPCYRCHGSQKKIIGVLGITISLSRIHAFMRGSHIRMVLFLICTLILISITAGLLIRHLVIIPIRKLARETAMITYGNLDHQVCLDTGDEIEDLARAFNLMTSQLQAATREVEDQVKLAASRLAQANQELETANQRLEESDRRKSEMMMAVAHDLHTPLAAIESCLRVVLDGYLKNDPDKEREMLQRIEARIKDQITLVKNLLDFSLITESCREMKEVNISDVIRKATDLVSHLASARKISIQVQEDTTTPLSVPGDEESLVRALTNLLDNAIKYSPLRSTIWISSQSLNHHIQLVVRDYGPGIPAEELPLIFDFLFRGRSAKRQKKQGSGLGLSIVKQIIDLHKGEIRVESEKGEGTSFFITLPRCRS
ncbi:MAG: HAMP domain-containing sensor histidine kinase [bacterium]